MTCLDFALKPEPVYWQTDRYFILELYNQTDLKHLSGLKTRQCADSALPRHDPVLPKTCNKTCFLSFNSFRPSCLKTALKLTCPEKAV